MQTFGAADLLILLVFVVLVLDSRRLHALARSKRRGRPSTTGPGFPPGANPDRAGLTLRDIQMRRHVDWEDGGLGREGPEILPAEESEDRPRQASSTTSSPTATRPPATTAA
jgi:hypothetical protein